MNTSTDCRSEVGVTVGLIDTIITVSRVLIKRDLSSVEVREALKDLHLDEDVRRIVNAVPGHTLVDQIIEILDVLAQKDLENPESQEALGDLRVHGYLKTLLENKS